ncbi:MAG: hypothetical protein IPN39_08735 [Chitinophagaceae bacterium]|nr:hypothetical protein [Chitinophagaceae bacterium]
MKAILIFILVTNGILLCVKAKSQTMRLIDFFESAENPKFQSRDFNSLGIRRNNKDSCFYVSSIRGNKFIIKVPRNSIFEVFDGKYLVISLKSPEIYKDGQPDFIKPRDSVFIIDLARKVSKRRKVYKTFLNGKTIYSNAIELIKLNKKFSYDYAVKSISLSSGTMVLLNLTTFKDEELKLTE